MEPSWLQIFAYTRSWWVTRKHCLFRFREFGSLSSQFLMFQARTWPTWSWGSWQTAPRPGDRSSTRWCTSGSLAVRRNSSAEHRKSSRSPVTCRQQPGTWLVVRTRHVTCPQQRLARFPFHGVPGYMNIVCCVSSFEINTQRWKFV